MQTVPEDHEKQLLEEGDRGDSVNLSLSLRMQAPYCGAGFVTKNIHLIEEES